VLYSVYAFTILKNNPMITNKLVRLEDVIEILSSYLGNQHSHSMQKSAELPTYPEPIKWRNHAILQEYIDMYPYRDDETGMDLHAQHNDFHWCLYDIQSRLTEWTEYELGSFYEFSYDGENWVKEIFIWYSAYDDFTYKYIRPIQVSPELTQAMEVMEKYGFSYSKK
jgi:hypothetical protein